MQALETYIKYNESSFILLSILKNFYKKLLHIFGIVHFVFEIKTANIIIFICHARLSSFYLKICVLTGFRQAFINSKLT